MRQVIPVIRSNDTQGTPDFNVGRNKRSADFLAGDLDDDDDIEDEEESEKDGEEEEYYDDPYTRPERARKTDRALRKVPEHIQQSRILNKKLRFLRMLNLKETKMVVDRNETHSANCTEKTKVKIVPRVSHPYHIQDKTNRKIQFVPRWGHFNKYDS